LTKTVLLTGGNGFIARSLNESLLEYNVLCLSKEQLNLLDAESVQKSIQANSVDVVIHCATYDAAPEFSTKDPNKVLEKNTRMFHNLARCSDKFEKMIYFGSGAEFSRPHWKPYMSEEYFDKHVPDDQYGYSKYLMNKHTINSNNIYNLRVFGLFGFYDDWRYRFIPNACCKALLDMPIKMRHNAIFDYTYIDDLIRVVRWAIDGRPKHKDYNVCTSNPQTYQYLASSILKQAGKDLDVIIENKSPAYEYSGDNSRIIKETGMSFMSVEESIEKIYTLYKKNKSIINKELFVY